MIDLDTTREALLARIGGPVSLFTTPCRPISSPAFQAECYVRGALFGRTKEVLREQLEQALRTRFSAVAEEVLFAELLYPLKKALGNAQKWGNRNDPQKQIAIECLATPRGVLIAVSDEGDGFDVDATLAALKEEAIYFTHGGSGFKLFAKIASVVSYEDSGRTLLLCFEKDRIHGRAVDETTLMTLGSLADVSSIQPKLEEALCHRLGENLRITNCQIFQPATTLLWASELRYQITWQSVTTAKAATETVSGRIQERMMAEKELLLLQEIEARLKAGHSPLTALAPLGFIATDRPHDPEVNSDTGLLLYRAAPTGNLHHRMRYLKKQGTVDDVYALMQAIGQGLSSLHQVRLGGNRAPSEPQLADAQRLRSSLTATLPFADNEAFQPCPVHFVAHLASLASLSRSVRQQVSTVLEQISPHHCRLVHGAVDWDHLLYQEDQLYLSDFVTAAYSHPAVDLGSFLAEVIYYYVLRKKPNVEICHMAQQAFLVGYFGEGMRAWQREIDLFTAWALLQKLNLLLTNGTVLEQVPLERWLTHCRALTGEGTLQIA